MDDLRYGVLTDQFEQLFCADSTPLEGSVIICGEIEDFIAEWYGFVLSPN